jgi:hypothetical protein
MVGSILTVAISGKRKKVQMMIVKMVKKIQVVRKKKEVGQHIK